MENIISQEEALTEDGNLKVVNNDDIIIEITSYTDMKALLTNMFDSIEGSSIKHKRQFNLILDSVSKEKFLSDLGEVPELFSIPREPKEGCIDFMGPNMTRVYLKDK